MPKDHDVIIAGGGPAGLTAAKIASAEGGEVLLLELQAQIGGQTQSAAWIDQELLDKRLQRSVISQPQDINLHSPHHELSIKGKFGAIVDRRIFDKILALQAAENGTEIWVGCPCKELLKERGTVCGVRSEAGEWSEDLESQIVIDATGASGQWSSLLLRKILKDDWSEERMTQSNEYLMANVQRNGGIDLYFNSFFAPLGHAWIYPLQRGFAMAGIRGSGIHPDVALDEFIGREEPARLVDSTPIGAFRGQLSVEGSLKSTCVDGMLSVGSAAGQTYPLSGCGLKYALEAGEIAGKVAMEAVDEADPSKERLMEYDRKWRNQFEKDLQVGTLLQKGLQTSPDRKMDALLKAIDNSSELQRRFVKIFLARELKENLGGFLEKNEIRSIFGREITDSILSLY